MKKYLLRFLIFTFGALIFTNTSFLSYWEINEKTGTGKLNSASETKDEKDLNIKDLKENIDELNKKKMI